MRLIRYFLRNEAGTAAVEFAFIGLLAIVLCVATVEFGRALHLANELSFAADKGSRLILIRPDVTDAEVVAEVQSNLQLANADGLEILTSQVNENGASARRLSVSLPLVLLIPTFRLENFRVSVERMVPAL